MAWVSHAGAAALKARRSQRLAALVSCAARDSPLYRRLLKGFNVASPRLADLPIAHKSDLMNRFGDWVTDSRLRLDELCRFTADPARIGEAFLGRYMVWESSGSSGEPGVFVQDAAAMAVYDALEALRRPWPRPLQRLVDPWYLAERIAFVGATGGHFASTVSAERLRRLNPALMSTLREISFLQPARRLADELQALSPTVLSTYPSAAVMLAQEQSAGRLHIQPKEVWTGGETLSRPMRRFVQQVFDCPVIDSYGASEFLSLASECTYGHLHLNSDWAILESVDDRGCPVPSDEIGSTTLLTNLANHLQPLIRYDLGDRIKLHSPPCACGSSLPVLEVQGRSGDPLLLEAPGGAQVHVLPLALTTVIEDEAGLFDFQVEQQGPCDLRLHTPMQGEAAKTILDRARSVLAAFLARQGAPAVRIHCHSGQPSQRTSGGKIQRVMPLRSPAAACRTRR